MKELITTGLFALLQEATVNENRLFTDQEMDSAYDEFIFKLEAFSDGETSTIHLLKVLRYTRIELLALQKKLLNCEAKKKCGRILRESSGYALLRGRNSASSAYPSGNNSMCAYSSFSSLLERANFRINGIDQFTGLQQSYSNRIWRKTIFCCNCRRF